MRWQNMVGRLCLAFALLAGLTSSVLLGPRLLADIFRHGSPLASLSEGDGTSLLSLVLPLLSAGLACASALIGWQSQTAHNPQEPDIAPGLAAERAAFQAMIDEMRSLMDDERSRWTELHEASGTAAREAMVVGVRLAGFAMDAEKQLSVSVEQVGVRLEAAAATLETASGAADRLERAASEQVAAMGVASGRMHRDAVSLDQACREIATAGAGAVARANEAVSLVETGFAGMPEFASAISTQTEHAVRALNDASEALKNNTGAHRTALEEARVASADLQDQVSGLAQAALAHTEIVTSAYSGFAKQAEALPVLIDRLGTGTRALEAAADEIVTVTRNGAASCHAMSDGLGRLEAAAREMQTAMHEESARMRAAAGACTTSGEAAVAGIEQAYTNGNQTMGALVESLSRRADDIQQTLNDAGEQFTQSGANAVTRLRDHTDFVAATLAEAGAILRGDAEVLSARVQDIDRVLAIVQNRVSEFSVAGQLSGPDLDKVAGQFEAEAKNPVHEIAAMIAGLMPLLHRFENIALETKASAAAPLTEALMRDMVAACERIEISIAALTEAGSREKPAYTTDDFISEWRETLAEQTSRLTRLQSEITATAFEFSQGMGHVALAGSILERSEGVLAGTIDKVQSAAEQVADAARAYVEAGESAPALRAVGPLARLAGVEAEVSALLVASEALAEATVSGRAAKIPDWTTGRAPEILKSVDAVIHHLKSVATAVAIASDAAALPLDSSLVA